MRVRRTVLVLEARRVMLETGRLVGVLELRRGLYPYRLLRQVGRRRRCLLALTP